MTQRPPALWENEELALIDLLDRALTKGVVIWGDVTISVADVDLVYLGLKVLLTSVENADKLRQPVNPAPLDLPARPLSD